MVRIEAQGFAKTQQYGTDCVPFYKALLGWTWDNDWYACYKSKSQDSAMYGDSGEKYPISNNVIGNSLWWVYE